MEELRRFEIRENKEWKEIKFQDLKEGQIFRAFEPTGDAVEDEFGNSVFEALDDYNEEGSLQPFIAVASYQLLENE